MALYFSHILGIQLLILLYFNLFSVIYIGNFRPFNFRKKNKIELFNEGVIYALTATLTIFTDFCPEVNMRYNTGWMCVGCMVFNVVINFGIMTFDTFLINFKICRKYFIRYVFRTDVKRSTKLSEESKAKEVI